MAATAMMDESGAAVLTTDVQMYMVSWYPHFVVNQNFNMANENTILTSVLQSYPLEKTMRYTINALTLLPWQKVGRRFPEHSVR
jgi:hypothetical protein